MKHLFGAILLLCSSMALASTEIWMMHDPDCVFCNAFLRDNGLEGIDEGEVVLIYRNDAQQNVEVTLVIVNLLDPQHTPDKVIDAINAQRLTPFSSTPHFYLWNTETKSVIKTRTGWHKSMKASFRNWVLTGDDPK